VLKSLEDYMNERQHHLNESSSVKRVKYRESREWKGRTEGVEGWRAALATIYYPPVPSL